MHGTLDFKFKKYEALKKISSVGDYSTVKGWCAFKIKFFTKFRRIQSPVKTGVLYMGFKITL